MLPAPQVVFMHAADAVREPMTRRHRPSGLTVFVSAFVAGAVVSFGLNHFVDAQLAHNRPQVECEPIFVALRSLPQGAPVTVWDVALKDWPLAMLPTSALRAEDSFEGTVLRYPLREGQPLLAVQLAKAPTDHSAIAADVETFKQPMPAATRQASNVESDSWLPAPKTTSTDISPAAVVAASPVEPPQQNATDQDDTSSLPLVAIADTPVETAAADPGPAAADDLAAHAADEVVADALAMLAPVEVAADAAPTLATPATDVLPLVAEPLEGIVATDEPRPFVVARRPRAPVAPQPQLDIADSIAALTRGRTSAPTGSSQAVSADGPATSVLVAQPETHAVELGAVEPNAVELGAVELGAVEPNAVEVGAAEVGVADRDAAEPSLSTPGPAAPASETLSAANADAPTDAAEGSTDTPPADMAIAQTDATPPSPEVSSMPMPAPRYLVIPERIALEADSFFGPATVDAGPTTAEAASPSQPSARPAPGTQAETVARPQVRYEAPPVTTPPPPTFGEMFPNIANGIDALSGPFRGRSAQQPRRTW